MVALSSPPHKDYLMQMFHDMEILQFLAVIMTVDMCVHSSNCLCLFMR